MTNNTSPPQSLWRHPDFLRLWTGETISLVGTQVSMLALPTLAILVVHASPFAVGVLVPCKGWLFCCWDRLQASSQIDYLVVEL